MKPTTRILIPILAALAIVIAIGAIYLAQLHKSVQVIEQSWNGVRKLTETVAPGLIQRTDVSDTLAEKSQALVLLREGESLEARGKWKDAQDKYKQSAELGGGTLALRKYIATAMQRRDTDSAKTGISLLRKEEAPADEVMLLEGLLDIHNGRMASARSTFGRSPDSAQAQYGQALISIAQKDHTTAKLSLEKAMQNSDPVIRDAATVVHSAYSEYALFPNSPQEHLLTLLGRALAQVGECEVALPLLAGVVNQQDTYRDAWIVKGYCELISERMPESLNSLEHAYSLDPEKPEIQYFLARTHAAMDDLPNAVMFLKYALENGFEPERDARVLLAEYAQQTGDSTLALDQYERIAKAEDADLGDIAVFIELAAQVDGKKDAAMTAARAALKKWPSDPLSPTLVGIAALGQGNKAEAQKQFNAALAIDPNYQKAKDGLARL